LNELYEEIEKLYDEVWAKYEPEERPEYTKGYLDALRYVLEMIEEYM
jgi:hypothetical protein